MKTHFFQGADEPFLVEKRHKFRNVRDLCLQCKKELHWKHHFERNANSLQTWVFLYPGNLGSWNFFKSFANNFRTILFFFPRISTLVWSSRVSNCVLIKSVPFLSTFLTTKVEISNVLDLSMKIRVKNIFPLQSINTIINFLTSLPFQISKQS